MALADCSENKTGPAEFMLLGFWALPGLKPVFFLIFLTFYVLTIMWNFLIIVTITCNICLHMPMYFYLGNLSLLEILYTTNIVPFMLYDLLTKHATVSVTDCLTQMFIFAWLACTECFLLTSMAYDRYVAICVPLRYTTVMNQALCLRLAIGSWVLSSMPASITMSFLSRIHISGYNEIDHFFCDFAPFLKAACTDTTLLEIVSFLVCFIVTSIPFTLIMLSYAYIIVAILRIPSNTGRHKVFSTCSSHITVVALYFGTLIAIYVAPRETKTLDFNKLLSLMYTVVTPLLNPIIYTLRNTDMIEAMKKTFYKDF